jgi:hypothetical protein
MAREELTCALTCCITRQKKIRVMGIFNIFFLNFIFVTSYQIHRTLNLGGLVDYKFRIAVKDAWVP